MKTILLAIAALAAASQAAEAVCSKNSLKGTWAAGLGPVGIVTTNTGANFPVYTPISPINILKFNSFNSSCKGTATITLLIGSVFQSLPANVTSELVNSASSVKPNLVTVRTYYGPQELVITMTRLQ